MKQGITLTKDDASAMETALLMLRQSPALTAVSQTRGEQTLTLTRSFDGGFTIDIDDGSPVVHHRFHGDSVTFRGTGIHHT